MPRHFLLASLIFVLLASYTLTPGLLHQVDAQGPLHVVINEFDQFPLFGRQWAELYNPASNPVDIGAWTISTTVFSGSFARQIPGGTVIPPLGYYVVEFEPFFLDPIDSLTLRNIIQSEVDRTPLLSKTVADGNAWARFPNGVDTDSLSDWRFQPATRGFANSIIAPPVTCRTSPPQVQIGSSVLIFGEVFPPRVAQVTIQRKLPADVAWSNLTTVTTTSGGTYSYTMTATTLGITQVKAYLLTDGTYPSADSPPAIVSVIKIQMTLSSTVTHPSIALGQEIATFGQITPTIAGVNLTLTYRKPTGNPVIRYVLTDAGGAYNDTSFRPSEAGSWNVTVSWQGDETHTPAVGFLEAFGVVAPEIPSLMGGEWIIGLVISVSISAILLAAAVTRKAGPRRAPRRTFLCPTCKSPLLYAPNTKRWYCPRCGKYF